jgi:alpha-amylase/alpha-mannosidase (GH57 family)
MTKQAICVHAHFYQPPRENPWLEDVEVQDSAHPFHDWNERITVECYAPNGAARLVDDQDRIREIVNNYARISFNFGPTLLNWIERHSPDEYERIVAADHESRVRQEGHGNAIAMPYSHMIMPLASERDRVTQIVWGIRDFERCFAHSPEGMWLPEAAVDLKTLDLMAQHGIRFTILAPSQAKRVRPKGSTKWVDVAGGTIDPRRPYLCRLPGDRSIALFFYDAAIAHQVAFERLLGDGEEFGRRLKGALDPKRPDVQLVNIATDGESYGHHWPHGDMALAYALAAVERDPNVSLTNYGRFLSENPPDWEVEISENSSWSCAHGIERWRSDCGCKLDPSRNWNQRWRAPLRESLDWLRSQIDPFFEQRAAELIKDPWAARNDYIAVISDRRSERLSEFCAAHQCRPLTPSALVELLKLLEMQRHGMLIYTSCSWFFDDISGLEAQQNLKFACRAIQLAGDLGLSVEQPFLDRLAKAESNIPEMKNGAEVYRRFVRPAMADLRRVAAHAAMESAFEGRLAHDGLFCYEIVPRDFERVSSGATSLAIGRVETRSLVTLEDDDITFAVLAFGGHEVQCSIRATGGIGNHNSLKSDLLSIYTRSSLTDVVRALDRYFGSDYFTLKDLFLESRRRILAGVTREKLEHYEGVFRTLFEDNQRLMEFVREADAPIPRVYLAAAECVLNDDLERAVAEFLDKGESERLREVLTQARRWNVPLRLAEMEPRLRAHLNALLSPLVDKPDEALARQAAAFVRDAKSLGLPLFFWQAQNLLKAVMTRHAPSLTKESSAVSQSALEALSSLGDELGFLSGKPL